jgi:hypothetical protein
MFCLFASSTILYKTFIKRHMVNQQLPTFLHTYGEKSCNQSGRSSSMMNLRMPMKMESLSLFLIGFNDAFSLGSLPIRQTTPRSKPLIFLYGIFFIQFCRVLLCCIKYLGNLPCPRCLVHKSEIHEIGMKRDFKRRETKIRVDDDRRRMLVETARGMLYEKGIRPNAKSILNLLASRSLTPTRVSSQCL